MKKTHNISKFSAIRFIILIGFVSLFADITYEGARSITGPYLAILGANATIVGFVAGFGEFIGYGLRLVSGFIADRTEKYWLITIIGYTLNMLAVPLLALAGHWWIAATLMILERMGKAIRNPARDAMLSHAGHRVGLGWGFGLHEMLDQIGAMLGPLIIAAALFYHESYQFSFAILAIPAFIALLILMIARFQYPHPKTLEVEQINLETEKLSKNKIFWIYLAGACLIGAGYADFPLVAFHFQKTEVLPKIWIPLAYGIAMGVDGLAAPLLGYLYDRVGFIVLIFVSVLSSLFAPLVFFGGFKLALLGVALWAIGMGAHESLMRAIIAKMIPKDKRASAYGVFNMGYGSFWFLGSVCMGMLYDYSILGLVIFSMVVQMTAVPLLWVVMASLSSRKFFGLKAKKEL